MSEVPAEVANTDAVSETEEEKAAE
jgi:hypothetical protein